MNAEFTNAYQEILIDNLMSIIKQNFIFQTQLKLAENVGEKNVELQNISQKLKEQNDVLNERLKELDSYKSRTEVNNSAHEEKVRIQSALNSEMQKSSKLQKSLDSLEKEIESLKGYIKSLEEIVPASKLKKINPSFNLQKIYDAPDVVVQKTSEPVLLPEKQLSKVINDGSSF